jgi:hypothetical protein
MYTLTSNDKWFVGQMHDRLDHDCHVSADSGCDVYNRLIEAYGAAKNEQVKRKLDELERTGGEHVHSSM